MSIRLPDLPFEPDALQPHMSARTLEFHHGKHHRAYVDKLNQAIAGTEYEDLSLEEIIARSAQANATGIYNNAAQAWNHAFLWHSLSPQGGGRPTGLLAKAMARSFGGIEEFRTAFHKAAAGRFGSGWAWLVQQPSGELEIITTANADSPLTGEATPLATLDVWEHAYYLDYQNARGAYIDAFLEHLINWEFAADNLNEERLAA